MAMATPARQRGLLTLTISNPREYFRSEPEPGNRRTSQAVTLCGLQWTLESNRVTENGVQHVGVFVTCSNDGEGSFKCKATCIIRVVNSLADDIVKRFCHDFSEADDNWGISDLLTVEDLLKPANGYTKNNTAAIQCNITAFKSPVSEVAQGACGSKRCCTDVKLVVEGRAVYANKGVLAASCDYFDAQFYSNFDDRHKDEITLDDVKHEDLVVFLNVINPPCAPIDENTVIAVLRLADRFGAKMFLEKCEQFIVDEMELKDAIIALDGCNLLSDLKAQLLDKISKVDLKSLCEEETFKQLAPETALLVVKELKRHAFP